VLFFSNQTVWNQILSNTMPSHICCSKPALLHISLLKVSAFNFINQFLWNGLFGLIMYRIIFYCRSKAALVDCEGNSCVGTAKPESVNSWFATHVTYVWTWNSVAHQNWSKTVSKLVLQNYTFTITGFCFKRTDKITHPSAAILLSRVKNPNK
jgi:hypothetical protein